MAAYLTIKLFIIDSIMFTVVVAGVSIITYWALEYLHSKLK